MSVDDEITPWLRRLGLERYAQAFIEQDVDLAAARLLTDADLRELGVTLGHRKRLLQHIALEGSRSTQVIGRNDASNEVRSTDSLELAERRLVSVLFCDMVGSTELTHRLDAEDMRQLLRDYQQRVAATVSHYGGHLAQYLGDGVMAYFGWPAAFEDQAERAVRAGLDAIAGMASLETSGRGAVRCRAAVATGEVVIGDLSEAGRTEGAIAGDAPALAARLQQIAAPGQLVVSDATRTLVDGIFELAKLGRHALKGFEQPVDVHRVTGVKSLESRFDATRSSRLSRFVGRHGELSLLREKWGLAKSGMGQVVLLSGEAGIGKSRLLRALTGEIGDEPMERWHLQCSPFHSGSSLFPVIHSLNRALTLRSDATAKTRLDQLEELLETWGADAETATPIIADLLAIDTSGRYTPLDLPPQELKDAIFATLISHCLAMARRSPLLLVIEDAHWIDPTTLELTEQVVASIGRTSLLIIVTHRPEWQTNLAARHGHVAALSLGRLPTAHAMELARDLVGPDATDELVDEIAARTGGVPMFVEEVARSIIEAGRLQGGALSVPTTLQSALAARLDALSPEEKELVQIACVMGRDFQSSLIATVNGRGRAAVERVLAGLCRSGIAIRSGYQRDVFSFRHALIQDAAYQSLLRTRRRQLHSAIANAIENDRPDIAEAQPEFIARHLSEAKFHDKALLHWHRAGQRALARYANLEAIQHFARAIEDAGRLTDLDARARETLAAEIEHAEALLAAGRTQAAMEAFDKAADEARNQRDNRAIFLCALGYDEARAMSNGLLNLSVERLNEALATLTESEDRERCHLMCRLTRAHALLGESEKADHFGQLTIELARRLREEGFVVEVMLHGLMIPSGGLSLAQMQDRLRQADEFLALVRASGYQAGRYHSKFVGRTLSLHLYQAAEFGERQRMDASLHELEAHSSEYNDLHFLWVARHGKAMQAILDGNFAAAETFADEGHEMGRQVHEDQLVGVYGMQMFTIRREQGRLSEVAPVVKRLIDEDPGQTAWRPGFALVACELGYTETARRMFLDTAETNFLLPHDGKRSTTLAYLAEVCVALGDEVRAEMLYRLLSPYAHMTVTTGVTTVCYGAAGRFLALLAGMMGDWRLAEEQFEAALAINRRMRAVPWIAHTQADLAAMLRRRNRPGDRRKAATLCEEASRTATEFGMQALAKKVEQQQY